MRLSLWSRSAVMLPCGCCSTLRAIHMLLFTGSARLSSASPAHAASDNRTNAGRSRGQRVHASVFSAAALLSLLMDASAVHAHSQYLGNWSTIYPSSTSDDTSCQLCHGSDLNPQTLNPYGHVLAACSGATGAISARIRAVENRNSDGDAEGATNLTEINANTQPGWTAGDNLLWPSNANPCEEPAGTEKAPASVGQYDRPVAKNDAYVTPFETPLNIGAPGVLSNDTPGRVAQNVTLMAVQPGGPLGGLTLNADGSFSYVPAIGFSGSDS
jgi:hypothetical protein